MSTHPLYKLLRPRSIAVVGASANPDKPSYIFLRQLLDHGYRGDIFPVNPKYAEVLGVKAYPNLQQIPQTVDYVICCIPAADVPNLIQECGHKEVKLVHIFTGGFSETGRPESARLEQQIRQRAQEYGIRLIGPNCMGLYHPREGIAFGYDFPREPGPVGMASQSGAGATYFVHLAALRGIRFSKIISYGNALDFDESDFLDYFTQDPETRVIVLYIEGIKDGRRFLSSLTRAAAVKPVIIVKGGRGQAGNRAAASHTAALSINGQIWNAAIAQAGAIAAENFEETADLAVSFCFLRTPPGIRAGIVGIGGGPSVLATDECEQAGLDVVPLPTGIRQQLKEKSVAIWDWIGNPVDSSILGGAIGHIEVLQMMARHPDFDLLIGIINEDAPFPQQYMTSMIRASVRGYIKINQETTKPLVMVVGEKGPGIDNYDHWRWHILSEARTRLIAANIPVYPSISRATRAAKKLADYYHCRERTSSKLAVRYPVE